MVKTASAALVCLLLYGILIIPFTNYLHNKPFVEKLGYVPSVTAFKEVKRIELARDKFRESRGFIPKSIEQLTGAGLLSTVPVDPYGGRFFIEADGKVATTSKFAFGAAKN